MIPEWLIWIPYILAVLVIGGISITLWEIFQNVARCA